MPSQDERISELEARVAKLESGWDWLLSWATGKIAMLLYGAIAGSGVGYVAKPTPAPVENRVEVERIIPYSPGVVKPAEEGKK